MHHTDKISLTALISCMMCLSIYADAQSAPPSLAGKWTETSVTQINRYRDKMFSDTVVTILTGCSITFTADMHFHSVLLHGTTDGDYMLGGDTLREMVPAQNKFVEYKVVMLTDHVLVTRTTEHIADPATDTEKTYTFTR